jgi:hypothetical protein
MTDATLYVARSDDRGFAPATDKRSAAEIWSDGQFFPTVYGIPRTKILFVQYYPEKRRQIFQ